MLTPQQREAKRRYIRYVIIFCCALIPVLALLQHILLKGTYTLPLSSTILIFALININGLLLLLMLYLVLRNLVELIFERKHNIIGSKLRTRLVVSFISLSFIPTALLFVIALSFVSTSMDYWFNSNVEESLQSSLR
ncbi:MAG: sensor histidine kinase, partial [Desulfobulbaceae bacterium]